MFAATHIFRPSIDFVAFAIANLACRSVVADLEGLEDATMESVAAELGTFADDELAFADQKYGRRAAYHCRGGRYGGDVGNRKRRYHNDRELGNLQQAQRKATRQMIEDGLAEYYSGEFRFYDLPRGAKRRGKQGGTNRGGASRALPGYGPRLGDDRPQVIEQSRTGHIVAVTVLPANCTRLQRKKALASIARTLPKLDTASIKERMGLN